ncbi:MAG: 4-alpha-glucanotransferase [Salinarimonas sp.]|nr:4-alpha-glucanotransferase [Salinarimonas sp.]
MNQLRDLAEAAGLVLAWTDYRGERREVGDDTLRAALSAIGYPARSDTEIAESFAALHALQSGEGLRFLTTDCGAPTLLPPDLAHHALAQLRLESGERREMRLSPSAGGMTIPPILEPGYHRVELDGEALTLAVAPARAYGLTDAIVQADGDARNTFGVAAQIYSLPPTPYSSFGDAGSLRDYARAVAQAGADVLAISPTHALYAANPGCSSPYAPSTRLFHNALLADPEAVFDAQFAAIARNDTPGAPLIDWAREGAAKLEGLRRLYERFVAEGPPDLRADFARFRTGRGALLEEHATYEALHAHFAGEQGAPRGWQGWPEAYRHPQSPAVAAFANEQSHEVGFHAFLQWLTERSLASAQVAARDAGMAVGLIADLAVGMDAGGSHAWSHPDDILQGVSLGAPPDPLGPLGQDWGLTTFSPKALREHGFAPFIATLRSAMRTAGGVRIDHVMGLSRLWLVPWGMPSTEGVYLQYPLDDMLRIVALESHRNRAIVIGEDLGTVPDGFRGRIDHAGILGMRVLLFEREHDGRFRAPEHWDAHAVAMTTTHDLPTISGWWQGNDIAWRDRLGQLPSTEDAGVQMAERQYDRLRFWESASDYGLTREPVPDVDHPDAVIDTALDYIARSESTLAIAPAEDIAGVREQPNLPGTIDTHPNWRRRLPEDAATGPVARARLARLAKVRPRPVAQRAEEPQ